MATAKRIKHDREKRQQSIFAQIRREAKNEHAKIYTRIEDLFADGVITPTEIVVAWAKRGKGKSALAAWFQREFMKSAMAQRSVRIAQNLCNELNQAGYNLHPPKDHCVLVDTSFEEKTFFGKRCAYRFNSKRWGLPNDKFETDPIMPGGQYFFDEGQKGIFNSKDKTDPHVSAACELSRQIDLFLFISTQRPKRIALDIRDLSVFFEVLPVHGVKSQYGHTIGAWWEVNLIYDNGNLESYLDSRDERLIDKTIIIYTPNNPWLWYDSKYFRYEFFKGFENKDFILEKCKQIESVDDLINHLSASTEAEEKDKPAERQKKALQAMEKEIELLKKTMVEFAHMAKSAEEKKKEDTQIGT